MDKQVKTIGLLALLLALVVMPFASAAGPVLTPTCTFVGSTPAANSEVEGNETITITARANYNLTNTTSLIFFGTNFTRGYALINLTGTNQTTMTASYANVPDGTYRIGAEFYIMNDTGNTFNTASVIACTNRTFTLETGEGGIISSVAVAAKQAESNNLSWLLLVALGALAVWAIFKDK